MLGPTRFFAAILATALRLCDEEFSAKIRLSRAKYCTPTPIADPTLLLKTPMLRTPLIRSLLVFALMSLAGCSDPLFVRTQQQGDRLALSEHWTFYAIFVLIGLAVVSIGALMLSGRLASNGRTRIAGFFFTLLGLAFVVGPMLTGPYTYVTLDRELLYIQGGILGSSKTSIDLTNVKSMEIDLVRRSGGSRKRRRSRSSIKVKFIPHRGAAETVHMGGNTRAVALDHLIEMAPELGITVTDRRDQ